MGTLWRICQYLTRLRSSLTVEPMRLYAKRMTLRDPRTAALSSTDVASTTTWTVSRNRTAPVSAADETGGRRATPSGIGVSWEPIEVPWVLAVIAAPGK